MDSISAGNTVAWAIECYEKGIITKEQTDGLELKWGSVDVVINLLEKMINRKGFGAYLADGVKRASEILGGKEYAMHIGGQEPGMHDSRNDPQLAVHYVAEPAPGKHTTGMDLSYGAIKLWKISSWAPKAKITRKSTSIKLSSDTALKSVANACYAMLTDGVGGCLYAQMFGVDNWNPCNYINASEGWNKNGDFYLEIGKRIQTFRQMFNIKHGIKPIDIKLPNRMAGKPPLKYGHLKNVTLKNDEMLKKHWDLFGWDKNTGIPTTKVIKDLGIKEMLDIQI